MAYPSDATATNRLFPYVTPYQLRCGQLRAVHVIPSGLVITLGPAVSVGEAMEATATNNPLPYVIVLHGTYEVAA